MTKEWSLVAREQANLLLFACSYFLSDMLVHLFVQYAYKDALSLSPYKICPLASDANASFSVITIYLCLFPGAIIGAGSNVGTVLAEA